MISRQVTDIVTATLSTLIAYMVISSSTVNTDTQLIVGLTFGILGINFLHLIFLQLNRCPEYVSSVIIGLNIILIGIATITFYGSDISEINGFWDDINLGYENFIYVISFIMLIFFIFEVTKILSIYKNEN